MLVMISASNLFRVSTPPGENDPKVTFEAFQAILGRLDHIDETLHEVLSIVRPVGAFLEANKHLIERAQRLTDPLGLRGRTRKGSNGRG